MTVRRLIPAVAAALVLTVGAARAASVGEASRLASAGAVELALSLIDEGQSGHFPTSPEWARWERQRIRILRRRRDWERLTERLEGLPDGTEPAFRSWARTQLAKAQLQAGRPGAARATLRKLLWRADELEPRTGQLALWRRLVIRSYLLDDRLDDARTAIARYRQDHPDGRPSLARSHARLLIREGRGEAALDVLDGLEEPLAALLRLRAGLATDDPDLAALASAARELAGAEETPTALRRRAWRLAATIADRRGEAEAAIAARERAIAADDAGSGDPLFPAPTPGLWQRYVAWGETLGNAAGLVIGDDAAWFELAEPEGDEPPGRRARALYALVADRSPNPDARAEAHGRFIRALVPPAYGGPVLREIYLSPDAPADPSALPPTARHHLADEMVALGDLERAARLVADLAEPPGGAEPVGWQLRRARILVLAGRVEAGAGILGSLVEREKGLTADQVDRLLQVVFDLQAVGRHQRAIGLFQTLLRVGVSDRQRREIHFWIADSHKARDEWREAARHYLLSATTPGTPGMDQWSQTARYRAAEALAEAGLLADAERLYRELLASTAEASRRALLENALRRVQARRRGESGAASDGD